MRPLASRSIFRNFSVVDKENQSSKKRGANGVVSALSTSQLNDGQCLSKRFQEFVTPKLVQFISGLLLGIQLDEL
jgi:hypothetical protein